MSRSQLSFWKPSWDCFPLILIVLQYSEAILYSLFISLLSTQKIWLYSQMLLFPLGLSQDEGVVMLDSWLFWNEWNICVDIWILFDFLSKCQLSVLHRICVSPALNPSPLSCVSNRGSVGQLVLRVMVPFVFQFIPHIHQEQILQTSVVCSAVKWKICICFQETSTVFPHRAPPPCCQYAALSSVH